MRCPECLKKHGPSKNGLTHMFSCAVCGKKLGEEKNTEGIWPDLIAPPQHENPAAGWHDPKLPDIQLIWKLAREVGYAVGVHGSLKRDFDLIAAPWTDEAVAPLDLILHICEGLGGKLTGGIVKKPHGRIGVNIQLDGWFKVIDLSVMPLL